MQNLTMLNQDGQRPTVCLRVGNFKSAAVDGLGTPQITRSTNTAASRLYVDDGGAVLYGSGSVPDLRGGLTRLLLTKDNTGGDIRVHALMGQLKAYDAKWNDEVTSAVHGRLELVRSTSTMTLGGNGVTAAVLGIPSVSGAVTVNTNHVLAGVAAISDFRATLTQTGKVAAFFAGAYDTTNWSDSTARTTWGYGLLIGASAATTGIDIGACTTALSVSGATTTGISITGGGTDGVVVSGTYTSSAFRAGNFASSYATGSAIVFSANLTGVAKIYGESTSDLTSAVNARTIVGRHLVVTSSATINHETYGIIGQVCVKNSSLGHYHGGVMGTFETNTAATVLTSYGVGAVVGRVGTAGLTVNSGGLVAGVLAVQNTASWTNNGTISAFATKVTAGSTAWPIGLYMASGDVVKGIDITCNAIGATGRIAKLAGTCTNAALTDGYGAVEIDLTVAGTNTDHLAAASSWVNILTGTAAAGTYVCAMNNGVYEDSAATITNAKVIFGMRCQKILGDTDALSFPLSINTNNTAITALIDVNNATDMGWIDGVLSSATGDGHIPLFRDAGGTVHYVNTYVA